MDILDQIVRQKRMEVSAKKMHHPMAVLEKRIPVQSPTLSMKEFLLRKESYGIIAEFKRKSPSRNGINEKADPAIVSRDYFKAGVSAISVLTDMHFFGGANDDLTETKKHVRCPVLRKDFIIDDYQVYESRSIGADAILLIADILSSEELQSLYDTATLLGMEVLFEVHDLAGIAKLPDEAVLIGVNSRNLRDFTVDQEYTIAMYEHLPRHAVAIAESGIDSVAAYNTLKNKGYKGFLIGELFMRKPNPGKACRQFVKQLRGRSYAG